MRQASKSMIRSVSFQILRSVPVERAPAFLSRFAEVKIPSAVWRKPEKSPNGCSNVKILYELLRKTADIPGDIAECGVFRGASLAAMGLLVKQKGWSKKLIGFDSFEGFDESIAHDIKIGGTDIEVKKMGGMNTTSYEMVSDELARLGLSDWVELVKGFFKDTLGRFADRTFSYVHLDCDIYQSYLETLEFFYPRMSPGGIISFDENNDPPWPGCNQAVDEFFTNRSERPVEIESENFQKWYIVKQ
jgi:O-methyltransferase